MHAGEFGVVGLGDVDVETLTLIDVHRPVGRHLDDRFLGDLPHCLIERLQLGRDAVNMLQQEHTTYKLLTMQSVTQRQYAGQSC